MAPAPVAVAEDAYAADTDIISVLDKALDADIAWGDCQIAERSNVQRRGVDAAAPIQVSADAASFERGPEQAVLSGKVQLDQGDLRILADELVVNRGSGMLHSTGPFLLSDTDLRIRGEAASYDLNRKSGSAEQVSYRVPSIRARGDAVEAQIVDPSRNHFREISYTTCSPGDNAWQLSASELQLDRDEGLGTARHATLRVKGVPVLYAPIFSFPIDDRRRSGVLIPTVGVSSKTGFDLTVPYYFNLAENYDLTLSPRLMTKRGLMLGGEFRYLTSNSRGDLRADLLPDDREFGDSRASLAMRHHTRLGARTAAAVRFNYVSDKDYLRDLGGSLAVASSVHLERAAELRHFGDTWRFLGRAQHYQTLDEDILARNRPYSRLPQLRFDLLDREGIAGTSYHLDAEYVNFHRKDSVRGHRLDLFPAISLPLQTGWGFLEPKLGARYTAYRLTDQLAGRDSSPAALTPMFSLHGGLHFDRPVQLFGRAGTQTLEPRIFYLRVAETDQDDHPVFDTGAFDFTFDSLFRENRYNGADRFGDADQVTLGLTSRFLDAASGAELISASIGQILYFRDPEVRLPGEPQAGDSSSALVGELAAELGAGWYARAGLQWDPHRGSSGHIDQALAQLGYRDDRSRLVNIAYRLRDGITEQTDLALHWPINERLSLVGRHNYSLQDKRLLEALAGIEYGRCCWRLRALLRQYADDASDDDNIGFMVQLELNGLGRFGDDIDAALERGIYGYRAD